MGLLRSFAVAGIAKRVFDEARKPENQRKMKEAVEKVRSSRGGQAGSDGEGSGTRR